MDNSTLISGARRLQRTWSGIKQYFGAVYEHLDDDLSCEGEIGLAAASEVEFEDDGHAIAWAMAN